jgi:pilus assembly protein CpaE
MEDSVERANETPLSILVIASPNSNTERMRTSLEEWNYGLIGIVDSVDQAVQIIQETQVDIILADSSAHGALETEWIQALTIRSAETVVIVIAANSEMEFVQRAMLAGAQGFLVNPFDVTELHKSIQQVHQLSLQRKATLAEATAVPDATSTPPSKAYSTAVFSPKGGTGATTLAVNLAIALKEQTGSPVLLVDADLRTADVDIFLSTLSKHSIYNLLDFGARIDEELLERVVAKHTSGVSVLRGEPQLQFDVPVEPGQMSDLIEGLGSIWGGYIVFNTSDGLDRWTVEILDSADTVLVVTTPELPALRATRNFLELADAAADQSGKWQLVMSSYQGKKVLPIADIEASIRYPVKATIAEDIAAVSTSINRGMPLVVSHRKSPVAQDVIALAKELARASRETSRPQSVGGEPSVEGRSGQPEDPDKRSSFRHAVANSFRLPAG